MKPYIEDIICAQATPVGQGAVSIIRVSGKDAKQKFATLFEIGKDIQANHAYYKKFYFEKNFIDEVLVLFFEEGKSFTGEESFEIQCHGSPFIVNEIIGILLKTGIRLAEPGEFSYRAYVNGKMDLTKAEGIHHTIKATSEISKDLALNLISGGLKNQLLKIKDDLIWAASRVEASIDFSDQDIDLNHDKEVFEKIISAKKLSESLLQSYNFGAIQSKGIKVALAGVPNAGKSTLFNKLVDEERSIISNKPGTTRDYIQQSFSLNGNLVELIDTAGLRDSVDEIESIGIQKAFKVLEEAQLILFLISEDTHKESQALFNKIKEMDKSLILVETKQDLKEWSANLESFNSAQVSAENEQSIEKLKAQIFASLKPYFASMNNLFIPRHKELVSSALDEINKIVKISTIEGFEDVISTLLYSAIDSINEILYTSNPEEVRDKIFKEFCLGK